MKWYKRDPDAAMIGMRELSDRAYRGYNVLIDLLYSRNGNVNDDDCFVSMHIGWRPQKWRKAKAELLLKGKIRITPDGKLTANRVETLLKTYHRTVGLREVSEANPKQNQRMRRTNSVHKSTGEYRSKKDSKRNLSIRRKRVKASLPENWEPELKFEEREEFERFKDYARANAKQYADWEAAWRNWKRSPYRNKGGNNNGQGRRHGSVLDAIDRFLGPDGEEAARRYIPGSEGPRPLPLDRPARAVGIRSLPKG